jgi:peptidoglycan/LPS O-acetylase OafA/YrhL
MGAVHPDSGTRSTAPPARAVAGGDTATSTDPGKQSRVAAGIPVVAAFDGYRAYAILAIVLLHVLGYSGVLPAAGDGWFAVLINGTLGQWVDALFIVSGFVVFLPTVARDGGFGNVGSYTIRRLARLAPAYWLVLVIMLMLTASVTVSPPLGRPSIGSVAAHMVFLQTPAQIFWNIPMGFNIDGPLWTLSLEITFYVLLPFVAAWYFRRPFAGLAIAAVITVLWHEALIHSGTTYALLGHPDPDSWLRALTAGYTQFPFFAFSFGAGMTGAWLYVRLRGADAQAVRRWIPAAQVLSLVGLAVFGYFIGHNAVHIRGFGFGAQEARRSPILALGYTSSLATFMIATALGARRWQRPFAHPFARRLGDISYGIYLIHSVVVAYAIRVLTVNFDGSLSDFLLLLGITVPIALAYAYVSARYLEQPIRRWAQRYGRRLEGAPAPT